MGLKAQVFETKDTELFEEIFEYRIPLFDFEKGRISNHCVSTRDSNHGSITPWRLRVRAPLAFGGFIWGVLNPEPSTLNPQPLTLDP